MLPENIFGLARVKAFGEGSKHIAGRVSGEALGPPEKEYVEDENC